MSWERKRKGQYAFRDGLIDAIVVQDEELWRSFVYVDGREVDRGEWDGRGTALKNARGAIRRARSLRTPLRVEDEEDDNPL